MASPDTACGAAPGAAGACERSLSPLQAWVTSGFGLSSLHFTLRPFTPPFGPLNALHSAALSATTLTWHWRVLVAYAVLPLFPVFVQAYLLVGPQTPLVRAARMALGGASIAAIAQAWSSYRFTGPQLNAFNNVVTIMYLHVFLKTVEFALLRDQVRDPWMARGRNRLLAAQDLCFNSRMLCLGSVGLDDKCGPPNEEITTGKLVLAPHLRHLVPVDSPMRPPTHSARRRRHSRAKARANGEPPRGKVSNGSVPVPSAESEHSSGPSDTATVSPEPPRKTTLFAGLIPRPVYVLWTGRPTTRAGALIRHMLNATTHYLVLDTFLVLLKRVAHDIGAGGVGVLETYVRDARFTALPHALGGRLAFRIPPALLAIWIQACVPIVIWQGLNMGYHAAAFMCLLAGWEVASWDVDLFDAPWRADSLVDLWGRRWHQTFRHQFIILSSATLRLFGLPNTPTLLFPLVFVFSGLLHVLGELSMDPVPDPAAIFAFFLLCGVGCACEVAFKKATGRRVGGWAGRLWCWSFMLVVGRLPTDAWLDAAIAGCSLVPAGGAGEYIAPWIMGWGFELQ